MRTELAREVRPRGLEPDSRSGAGRSVDPLHVPEHVIGVRKADAVAVCDGRRYYTLNDFSGRVWELIRDGAVSIPDVVEGLSREYEVPGRRLELDAAGAIRSLTDSGLISQGLRPAPKARAPRAHGSRTRAGELRTPSVLECALTLAWVKLTLRLHGWPGTVARLRRRVEHLPPDLMPSRAAVSAVERRVALAAAFYPGRARCLEQSLTLYSLLRSRNVGARYCQGVQFYPFEAHAWIEYRGEVINDVGEHVKHFARFPEQLP